jgi:hypothetical protein
MTTTNQAKNPHKLTVLPVVQAPAGDGYMLADGKKFQKTVYLSVEQIMNLPFFTGREEGGGKNFTISLLNARAVYEIVGEENYPDDVGVVMIAKLVSEEAIPQESSGDGQSAGETVPANRALPPIMAEYLDLDQEFIPRRVVANNGLQVRDGFYVARVNMKEQFCTEAEHNGLKRLRAGSGIVLNESICQTYQTPDGTFLRLGDTALFVESAARNRQRAAQQAIRDNPAASSNNQMAAFQASLDPQVKVEKSTVQFRETIPQLTPAPIGNAMHPVPSNGDAGYQAPVPAHGPVM